MQKLKISLLLILVLAIVQIAAYDPIVQIPIPHTVVMPLISITSDVVQVKVKKNGTITEISGSLQALVSGTATVVIKNNAGTQLGTISFTSAGFQTGTISLTTISANDRLHFEFTSVGVGAVGCVITTHIQF